MKATRFFLFAAAVLAAVTFTACDKGGGEETKPTYTVTFDAGGGTPAPVSQRVKAGETAATPTPDPAKSGYEFLFWRQNGATAAYDFGTSVNGDITLTAQWEKDGGLAAVAAELGEDADYSLFAATLAEMSDESGNYTVFALSNSVIEAGAGTRALPVADVQWHIVRGKYETEELLQAQTLQTVGGQTLRVVCETVEIAGEEEMFLYINDIPVDYRSVRLMDGSAVYPIGTNIARISNAPATDDLDAYNNWAALAMEGKWRIERVEKRKYHVWSISGREDTPFDSELDLTHMGCCEVFERNPAKALQGYAGIYETEHRCGGAELGYDNNGVHGSRGWWSVDASCILFSRELWAGGPLVEEDRFIFAGGIGRTITCTSGYGGDGYYGGDEDVVFDTYYETEYTLRKVAN